MIRVIILSIYPCTFFKLYYSNRNRNWCGFVKIFTHFMRSALYSGLDNYHKYASTTCSALIAKHDFILTLFQYFYHKLINSCISSNLFTYTFGHSHFLNSFLSTGWSCLALYISMFRYCCNYYY